MSNIQDRLNSLFDRHRIVFWYDELQELRPEFESLELAGVEKRVVENDEFGVKVHVLHRRPERKFLLYFPSACPDPRDNWLLDLLLCHAELRTDPVELALQELELGRDYAPLIEAHLPFFHSRERREKFRELLGSRDSDSKIRMNMLAVLCGCAPEPEALLMRLFRELDAELRETQASLVLDALPGQPGRNIHKFGLDAFFWSLLERHYAYRSEQPALMDFLYELLRFSIAPLVENPPRLSGEARTLLNHWKDSSRHREVYERLSAALASENYLNLKLVLQQDPPVATMLPLDAFREIDQKILSEIKRELLAPRPPCEKLRKWIDARRDTHWYGMFADAYCAMQEALKLLVMLEGLELELESFEDGLKKYTETFHRLDLHYRRFAACADESGRTELFAELEEIIEKFYVNRFLAPLNDQWQQQIEKHRWQSGLLAHQRAFHENRVRPFLRKNAKVFVLVSDALRYECAVELKEMIMGEDRFQAELHAMLGSLPSYTQLGMAALLPNRRLEMSADAQKVLVDGQSSQGLEGRRKILQNTHGDRAAALHLKDFMKLNREKGRALTRDHDVIYLFHNQIDRTGDDPKSEHRVFRAVKETQHEMILALKRISAFNGNNVLLTADHGFLFQKLELDENDFIEVDSEASGIGKQTRRFITGKGIAANPNLWNVPGSAVGLEGDVELRFPRGIHRLRKTGAGKQFVHGGPSLQEVVIPCLTIKKLRVSDVSKVAVSILGQQSVITTNQVTISFYQEEPVSEKVRGRTIKAGFFRKSGELISETYEITFDSEETESTLRETKKTFGFMRSLENNLECVLKLTSRVEGAHQYALYREYGFMLKKTFDSDFDL